MTEPQLGLCTRSWGHRLRRRLGYVEAWAERQGLELAADCHLCRVIQVSSKDFKSYSLYFITVNVFFYSGSFEVQADILGFLIYLLSN